MPATSGNEARHAAEGRPEALSGKNSMYVRERSSSMARLMVVAALIVIGSLHLVEGLTRPHEEDLEVVEQPTQTLHLWKQGEAGGQIDVSLRQRDGVRERHDGVARGPEIVARHASREGSDDRQRLAELRLSLQRPLKKLLITSPVLEVRQRGHGEVDERAERRGLRV